MFNCDKCGACCKNLKHSIIYASLDRGNGVCKYLNGNLCSIYENRPVICRVDESYNLFFKQLMSLDEYYERNYAACLELKKALTK